MRWVTYGTPDGPDHVGLIQGETIYALEPGVTLLGSARPWLHPGKCDVWQATPSLLTTV
jgi:hypothetical protein